MRVFCVILLMTHSFILIPKISRAWDLFSSGTCDDCILEHAGNTQSKLAVKIIYSACKCKFQRKDNKFCDSYLPKVCDCILDKMPRAENDLAARIIYKACKNKYGNGK